MATDFEILKTIAYYFGIVALDQRSALLADLIRLIRPPRQLLLDLANEMPPTPPPAAPAPAPEKPPRR
jgi:hypothetical protein